MVKLSGDERISTISLTVLIQYRSVTNGRADEIAISISRYE